MLPSLSEYIGYSLLSSEILAPIWNIGSVISETQKHLKMQ